jgi:tRNA uridine 5-carbamoylmethylation protein Kti12
MKTPNFPTPEQIQDAIKKVEDLLLIKKINRNDNFEIKEGFTDCLRILNERLINPENPFFIFETDEEIATLNKIYKAQLKDISKLKTIKGRAIAIMCVDWLNGNNKAIEFLSVKMKTR